MSWSIALLENTVEITEEVAKEIAALDNEHSYVFNPDYSAYEDEVGKPPFDRDAMEHMDYLHDKAIQRVLKKHKVNGRVLFADVEGGSSIELWGYRFKDGVLAKLKGTISWSA